MSERGGAHKVAVVRARAAAHAQTSNFAAFVTELLRCR